MSPSLFCSSAEEQNKASQGRGALDRKARRLTNSLEPFDPGNTKPNVKLTWPNLI